ncbi:MAG: hypothetical protein LBI26_00370 [Holosporales bacterium]|jgi:hypothetical protein|nr:hypothetical protein [Holosporales bacterium]
MSKIYCTYNKLQISWVKSRIFYGLSLDKRSHLFDIAKFINDPWSGNIEYGNKLLNNLELIKSDSTFSWIRDLQAIGGNSVRKYVCSVTQNFISSYRKSKRFWEGPEWETAIVSERVVNWILSYSFFVASSDDKFQKLVLSSLTEQLSHINRIYKSENNQISRLRALKAMLFCFIFMKNNNRNRIKKIISEISQLISKSFDNTGLFITRNPGAHFEMFKNILEIRFVMRNANLEFPFNDLLSKMAMHIRYFRMGDGILSNHSGDRLETGIISEKIRSNLIDSALSFVNPISEIPFPSGFSKLSTKDSVIILNTMGNNARSKFDHINEPGINIFDFEATFKNDRVINRSDVAILYSDGRHRIKIGKYIEPYVQQNNNSIECELADFNKRFRFALRREIVVNSQTELNISVSDFFHTGEISDIFIRCVFNENATMEKTSNKVAIIKNNNKRYRFFISEIFIDTSFVLEIQKYAIYPTIVIHFKSVAKMESKVNWILESF